MKSEIVVALIIGLGLIAIACIVNIETKKSLVYDVCNTSQLVTDSDWEVACGKVQDVTNTEFICEGNNCKVEKK